MWLQRCLSPIYQSFSCYLQNVSITPGVNIPPIKNSSITECSCHWQVFHLLYINTFPNITYILYISIFCTLHVMIGFDFRGYSPFHSDSESHVDRGAKSNCRHRVKHINIALNRSNNLLFRSIYLSSLPRREFPRLKTSDLQSREWRSRVLAHWRQYT